MRMNPDVCAADPGYQYVLGMYAAVKLSSAGPVCCMCDTCRDRRGVVDYELIEGATRSTMDELALEALAADKVLVF
jgi:sulfur relay (sulfurtransferase) complex TusBCD TusD component (DsrE family)